MRRDHRPFAVFALQKIWHDFYVRRFLSPQFDSAGDGLQAFFPRNIMVTGSGITLGKFVHIHATPTQGVMLSTWRQQKYQGRIAIGDYALLSPGSTIIAANSITLGQGCMIAANAYISDADWHGIYDRTSTPGSTAPIVLGDNVWIGHGAKVCKGVTIGNNSIVGAGSIVTRSIPANCIAVGSPATPRKQLDQSRRQVTRQALFANPRALEDGEKYLHKMALQGNSFARWLRVMLRPTRQD